MRWDEQWMGLMGHMGPMRRIVLQLRGAISCRIRHSPIRPYAHTPIRPYAHTPIRNPTALTFSVLLPPSVDSRAPLCRSGPTEALFDIQLWLRPFGRVWPRLRRSKNGGSFYWERGRPLFGNLRVLSPETPAAFVRKAARRSL